MPTSHHEEDPPHRTARPRKITHLHFSPSRLTTAPPLPRCNPASLPDKFRQQFLSVMPVISPGLGQHEFILINALSAGGLSYSPQATSYHPPAGSLEAHRSSTMSPRVRRTRHLTELPAHRPRHLPGLDPCRSPLHRHRH